MFDYASWIERAHSFVSSLSTLPGSVNVEAEVSLPLSSREADDLATTLPLGLSPVIRGLMTQGSSCCNCHYIWRPPADLSLKLSEVFPSNAYIYGGPVLCSASNLAELQEHCSGWAQGFDEDDEASRKNRALWVRCTPFAHIGNGDFLALDVNVRSEDPPVAYLSHEGEGPSSIIAPSFTEFLRHWEALSYIGPEIWLLNSWIRTDSGYVDSVHPKTELLRNLLLER